VLYVTLKRATDKLWEAGERQLTQLGENAAIQSREMQAPIKAATDSANAAIASNQIAVTTAEQQLRAYVTAQEINLTTHRHPDRTSTESYAIVIPGAIHTYRLAVVLKNGGQTPAINCKINFSCEKFNGDIPADSSFPDSKLFGSALIGPQTVSYTPSIQIVARELENSALPATRYLWGWIEYDDIFRGTTRHRTEFCFQVVFERLEPTNESWLAFLPYSKFNAADGGCLRPVDPHTNKSC
jgi:hypothetical protein